MKNDKKLKNIAVLLVFIAFCFFIYLLNASKALSYLSKDPKACINCHVMNTQYSTWQKSSHKNIDCIECHLPTDGFVKKYMAKAKDGWNHSVAFTLNTYDNAIKISEDGANRVQANCKSCHSKVVSSLGNNNDLNHNFNAMSGGNERKCWSCHKSVPHGKVRGLTTSTFNLGVKENK